MDWDISVATPDTCVLMITFVAWPVYTLIIVIVVQHIIHFGVHAGTRLMIPH